MNAASTQAVRTLLCTLTCSFRRFFADGEPLAEPIDLYPRTTVAGPVQRLTVLEALHEAVAKEGQPKQRGREGFQSACATVGHLRLATGLPGALLRSALEMLGKEHLVRVEVHTLSRRFRLRPRHELRFHITAHGCSYLAKAAVAQQGFRHDSAASLNGYSS